MNGLILFAILIILEPLNHQFPHNTVVKMQRY